MYQDYMPDTLTDREKTIYDLLCQGYTTSDIARSTGLTVETVQKGHLRKIYRKLGIPSHANNKAQQAVAQILDKVVTTVESD